MNYKAIHFGFRISLARRTSSLAGGDFGTSTPHSAFRNPQSGISLIEVIMVMLIVAILAAVVIPRVGFDTHVRASLEGAAQMIASDIRYAQEFAMANRVSKSVVFTSGSSEYAFNPTSNLDPSGRLLSEVTVGTTITVTFNSLGEPTTGAGSVTISGGGQSKTISVTNYTGKVNIL